MLIAWKSPDITLSSIPPEKAISTFELPKGFKIELVAAKPMVADPISNELDKSGIMLVLEMHGFPLYKSGSGVVKLLTSRGMTGECVSNSFHI